MNIRREYETSGKRSEVTASKESVDIGLCVTSGQVFRWKQGPDGCWFGVDGPFWYQVEQRRDSLVVETNGGLENFASLFSLAWPGLPELEALVASNTELLPYLAAYRGLRVMRPGDPVETFFSFLCTPNNNVARITGMVNRLAAFGPVMAEVCGAPVYRFPCAERISEITEGELRGLGFGYRGSSIPIAARELVHRGGAPYLEELKRGSYERAFEELLSFPGIGPKLADCIALFGLHHTEAVPIDVHVWRAVKRLYFPEWKGTNLTESKYRAVGDLFRDRFGSMSGWVQQLLYYGELIGEAPGPKAS